MPNLTTEEEQAEILIFLQVDAKKYSQLERTWDPIHRDKLIAGLFIRIGTECYQLKDTAYLFYIYNYWTKAIHCEFYAGGGHPVTIEEVLDGSPKHIQDQLLFNLDILCRSN